MLSFIAADALSNIPPVAATTRWRLLKQEDAREAELDYLSRKHKHRSIGWMRGETKYKMIRVDSKDRLNPLIIGQELQIPIMLGFMLFFNKCILSKGAVSQI